MAVILRPYYKRMKTLLMLLLSLLHLHLFAQTKHKTIVISFLPLYENKELKLNTTIHPLNSRDSLSIQTLKFYISAVELYAGNNKIWSEPHSYHLVDAEEAATMHLNLKAPAGLRFNRLHFNLGIDSITNAAGAGSEDLDATKGMYWAWQSGYINFKLEGTHPLCKTRKHAFEFHLGGFRGDDYCLRQISLPVKNNSDTICVLTDVSLFLNSLDLSLHNMVMTPGIEAVELSKKVSKMFSIK